MKTEIRPAVAAAIFNHEGKILLQKRKDVNQWGLISGHVEFGETLEAAVLREIYEETNVKGSIKRFIGVYSSPSSQTYHYSDRTVQYVTSYFEAELEEKLLDNFSNEETTELRFFSPAALPNDLAMMNPFWLNDALDKAKVFVR